MRNVHASHGVLYVVYMRRTSLLVARFISAAASRADEMNATRDGQLRVVHGDAGASCSISRHAVVVSYTMSIQNAEMLRHRRRMDVHRVVMFGRRQSQLLW